MLLFQVFINVGMNVGLTPVTGVPLPLISYGGSSLITMFLAVGILQSVLVYAHARRYDSPPAVRVPSTIRLQSIRLAPWWPRREAQEPGRTAGSLRRRPQSAPAPEAAAGA